uniref:Retrotransposon protein, putative, unclassified n=1 Tax=Oryza sativa subsp. japonica TaxID=39947 RepID=Q2QMY6_ORYSJ|nr:retrotransposon protein, putative, unclassified [Oryza sativa Japonica Group]
MIMVEVLEEEAVVFTPTSSGSEDASESHGPRHHRRNSPTPPRHDPSRREDPNRSGGLALSPPPGGGRPRRIGAWRRLTYGDGGSPRGTLQAAGALLRHPPVNSEPETPVQRWLDDVAKLVTTAQRQLAAGGRPAVTGGDDWVMANYFPMALKGQACGWLMTQPPDSIHSWEDLYQQFVTNFQGTYPRPREEADLHAVRRKDDESLRSYIQRFCQVRNTIPCIPAHAVVYAFRNGVRHNRMLEKIASKETKITAELFELADKVARKEEVWAWNSPGTGAAAAATPESVPLSKRRDRRGKRKPARSDDEGHVLAADGPTRAPRKGKATGDKPSSTAPSGEGRSADKWCSVHNTYRHNLADCRSVKNLAERFQKADEEKRQGRREGKAPATPTEDLRGEAKKKAPADDGDNSEDLEFQIPQGTVATIDRGEEGACVHTSRRGFKAMRRELLAAVPTHEAARKARWSEVKLTFDQERPSNSARSSRLRCVQGPGDEAPAALPVIGVTPGHTWPLGHVELSVTFGDSTNFRTERIDFDVADLNLPYNAVLGRPALVKFMAATHYAYLQIKMLGPSGPITVFGNVKVALTCAEQRADNLAVATEPQAPEASASRASKKRLTSADEESALVFFLRANSDVFAWKPSDMPGVPREVIEHRLTVRPDARSVRQKVQRQAPEQQAFIREEVARLLEADFIREVIHPEWLANPVVVPKANGKLRMCIDYTDLNKACPKDPCPLPRIDQIVDSTVGVFGVPAGKLLGFLVSSRGIEANPKKIHAIERMRPPSKLRDVQCVSGCMAALSRFISRLGERALPLFKLLKRSRPFVWTEEAEQALNQLKAYLISSPHLGCPGAGETVAALLSCDPPCDPVPEAPNPQEDPEAPVGGGEALASVPEAYGPDMTRDPPGAPRQGRPRSSAPGSTDRLHRKVLADFIAEWTPVDDPVPSNVPSLPGDGEDPNTDIRGGHWVMHFDGSLNLQGAGAGVTLTSPSGDVLKYVVRLDFRATNNMAEYEGLLAGLRAAAGMGIRRLLVLGDSQLVVNQVSKEYQCTDPQMDAYVREVRRMERHFDGLELRHVPRRDNTVADELSRVASARAPLPLGPSWKDSHSHNGTQFTSELFGDYCDDMGIKLCFASPAHPKSNGQVERANAEILKGLKTKTYNVLKKHGDSWLEELPAVLWANRTTPSRATGETPFFLVYGAKAVLPSELSLGSPRVALYDEAKQDDLRRDDLDYFEERRRRAALRAARYQQSLRRYHQRHVRDRSLKVGDVVLCRVQSRLGLSKLSPMWEGPYKVIGVLRLGSVRLTTEDGTELPNPWNIEHLHRFYP